MIILANLVIIGAEAEMTVQNMDTSWARFAELSFLVTWLEGPRVVSNILMQERGLARQAHSPAVVE